MDAKRDFRTADDGNILFDHYSSAKSENRQSKRYFKLLEENIGIWIRKFLRNLFRVNCR